MKGRALALGLVAVLAAGSPPGHAGPVDAPFHVARAFAARAEAFPMESAPGTQDTEVGVRPAATKAVASNPPSDAFARAAAADLGLAEAYFGQQGPAADADTATADGDRDVVVDEGGSHLEAHVDVAPRASASATGNATGAEPGTSGSVASESAVDGSGRQLVATVEAEVNDMAIGALFIGSGRFDARVAIDGTPGSAEAAGRIRTSDATFDGIPITLGADGVQVDESRVPAPLLGEATAGIQEAFGQGGFADIRVVQPKIEVAEDGRSARVFGGGVRLFFTNNDPEQEYFFSYTLLGGSAEVFFGGELALPTPDRVPAPPVVAGEAPPTPTSDVPSTVGAAPTTALPAPSEPPAADDAELAFDEGAERVALRVPWPGWVWLLLLLALAWLGAGALQLPALASTRARLEALVDDFADRYFRG